MEQPIDRLRWPDAHQPRDGHLEDQTRSIGAGHLVVDVEHHMEGAHQNVGMTPLNQFLES